MSTRRRILCSGEKKFSAKARHNSRIQRSVAGWYRRDASVLEFQQRPLLHTHRHRCVEQICVPLKSKNGSETADAIVEIIRANGRCPKHLQTDMGKEFYNVQKILKKHVNHYSTYSTLKASIVERFKRTLQNDKMFILNGNYKDRRALPHLVLHYNVRNHQTIGMRPAHVTPADRLLDTMYSAIKIAGPAKFKVGDSIRVSKYKTIFEKNYTPNWTLRYLNR